MPGYFAAKGSHPPKAGAYKPRHEKRKETSTFRKLYDRGDFPISVNHDAKGKSINWKVGLVLLIQLGVLW